MTLSDLKAGLISLLKTRYPEKKYKYYSKMVVENYERPCFFTQIVPVSNQGENYNTRKKVVLFYITIFQNEVDEAEALDMIDTIQDLFGLAVKIKDRAVDVTDFDWQWIGTEKYMPELSITLEWYDDIIHEDDSPIIGSVAINSRLEEIR